MRLKQGVIEDSDKVFRDEEPEKHYTLLQRIGNWFYHAKWWLGIATFLALLGAFLIYDVVTRENPDLSVLLLSANNEADEANGQGAGTELMTRKDRSITFPKNVLVYTPVSSIQ